MPLRLRLRELSRNSPGGFWCDGIADDEWDTEHHAPRRLRGVGPEQRTVAGGRFFQLGQRGETGGSEDERRKRHAYVCSRGYSIAEAVNPNAAPEVRVLVVNDPRPDAPSATEAPKKAESNFLEMSRAKPRPTCCALRGTNLQPIPGK